MVETESDFGKGLVYPLILFAMHVGEITNRLEMNRKAGLSEIDAYELWFYGASDHLLELEVPPELEQTDIGQQAQGLRDFVVSLRMHGADKGAFETAMVCLKRLAMALDAHIGVTAVRANFE